MERTDRVGDTRLEAEAEECDVVNGGWDKDESGRDDAASVEGGTASAAASKLDDGGAAAVPLILLSPGPPSAFFFFFLLLLPFALLPALLLPPPCLCFGLPIIVLPARICEATAADSADTDASMDEGRSGCAGSTGAAAEAVSEALVTLLACDLLLLLRSVLALRDLDVDRLPAAPLPLLWDDCLASRLRAAASSAACSFFFFAASAVNSR